MEYKLSFINPILGGKMSRDFTQMVNAGISIA
jgi:hypothetical protein